NEQIYHYTLYYYDQAGNLIRTVPPEGVTLLTSDEIARVTEARGQNATNCNYTGPTANTIPDTAWAKLSTALAGASRSLEMWLYNDAGTANQVLTGTGDGKYLFHVCVDGRYLNVDIYTFSAPNPDEAEITLSNHAT